MFKPTPGVHVQDQCFKNCKVSDIRNLQHFTSRHLIMGGMQRCEASEGASSMHSKMSRLARKPALCICENKDADQLRGNHEADQRLCFAT